MKKIVFIVNPVSGTANKRSVIRQIDRLIDKERFDYSVVTTEYAGHATELARAAANEGVDIVCAIGGDGTVNETARALVHTNTALAIIPCGSGNGLARHLHIPMDAIRAIKLINDAEPLSIDYGLINLHPFFCTCGVGFDAFISQKFAEAGKRGPATYVENILMTALTYSPETYELDVLDENEKRATYKAFMIACANASQYGNNAYIAPQASVRDGVMDVTIVEPFTVLEAPQLAVLLFNGAIDESSRIKTFRCKHLVIRRSKPGVIHYDGDPVESGETVDVSIVSKGLLCICPTDEGVMDVGESARNSIVEYFNNMYLRSEDFIENHPIRKKTLLRRHK